MPSATSASSSYTPWSEVPSRSLRDFLRTETGSAGLLLAATLIALIWANSPFGDSYADLWHTPLELTLGQTTLVDLDLGHWVNDALMAWFFYIVGLEIRRELALGELRDRRAAAVPAIAALAGMAVPALLYTAVNAGGPGAHGWGIVMATDIAFVLGTLALLGNRIPAGVRVFLLTLAIVDDIGAIIVIAAFYSKGIAFGWLAGAAGITVLVWLGQRIGPAWRGPAYFAAGVVLWYATLRSGVHPTIAGVVMGLLTAVHPPQRADVERAASVTRLFRREPSPKAGRAAVLEIGAAVSANERFQQSIHPWTSYLVVPIFALANAGVPLSGDAISAAAGSAITLGVIAGLLVGKAAGISLITLLAVRARVGPLPTGVRPGHIPGAAALAGIGFTVSLFVADLAFTDQALRDQAKIGVLVASLVAAIVGLGLLARRGREEPPPAPAGRLAVPVDPRFDWVRGPWESAHSLVIYGDYACPHTARLAPEVDTLLARHGDAVQLTWRQMPNEAEHPGTMLASEAALAAEAQGAFWPLHERLIRQPVDDDLGPADLLDHARAAGLDCDRLADDLRHHVRRPAVESEIQGALHSGALGTPAVYVNGRRIDGELSAEQLAEALGLS